MFPLMRSTKIAQTVSLYETKMGTRAKNRIF